MYKNLDLLSLIKKIEITHFDLKHYVMDIKYNFKKYINNIIEINQRIIIFGLNENLKLLNSEFTTEFFVDNTFKIIPSEYRPYKLFIIAGIPEKENNAIINCFIFIKYLDIYTYDKIFNYLSENFNFHPKVIVSDFESALHTAIKNNQYMKEK